MASSEVLYEVSLSAEWDDASTSELLQLESRHVESKARRLLSTALYPLVWILQWIVWKFLDFIGKFFVPDLYLNLRNAEIPWKLFAARQFLHDKVSGDTILAAVVANDRLEIRKSTDEFAKPVEEFQLKKDDFIRFRKLAWSNDGQLLALVGNDGTLTVFDYPVADVKYSTISQPWSTSKRIVRHRLVTDIIWVSHEIKNRESVLIATGDGILKRFGYSSDDGLKHLSTMNLRHLSSNFCKGISSILYSRAHNLLLVGSTLNSMLIDQPNSFWASGLSLWRFTDDSTYIVPVYDIETKDATKAKRFYSAFSLAKDGIFKMALNDSETTLATLFMSGSIAVWSFPSLRLKRFWNFEEIPEYCSSLFGTSLSVGSKAKSKDKVHYPVDVKWWSDDAIILNQAGGAVSLLDITGRELINISHGSFEQFHPGSIITPSFGDKFLVLEANTSGDGWRKNNSFEGLPDMGNEADTMNSEDATVSILSQTLASLGVDEKSSSDSTAQETVSYRLHCFQSASPAEFFQRKLANEEYGEALLIADRFGLDRDLVYQSRWLKNPITNDSINDFLGKISNSAWALRECLDRAPNNPDVARQLLDMGLRMTDVSRIIELNPSSHVLPRSNDLTTMIHVAANVESQLLSPEQKAMISHRKQLIHFKNMLSIYEQILGGGERALRYFLTEEYQEMRQKTPLELAYDFARAGKVKELHTLHFLCMEELRSHWLGILSNIPETLSPDTYLFLIPSVLNGEITKSAHQSTRPSDWCENHSFDTIGFQDYVCSIKNEDELEEMTPSNLGKWFERRIHEIERRSGLIANAQELLEIANVRAPEVVDLEDLKGDLQTLSALVFNTDQIDLSLDALKELSDSRILRLFDKKKDNHRDFSSDLRNLMIPFVERCQRRNPGSQYLLWREYVMEIASDPTCTLEKCLKIFQQSLPGMPNPILPNVEDVVELALDCVLACSRPDQLDHMKGIMDILPLEFVGHKDGRSQLLGIRLKNIHGIIRGLEFANGFGIQLSAKNLLDIQSSADSVLGFLEHVLKTITRKVPGFTDQELSAIFLRYLLLSKEVFPCLGENKAVQLFASALLVSGRVQYIQISTKFFNLCTNPTKSTGKFESPDNWPMDHLISPEKSTRILLEAGKEYFNTADNWRDAKIQHASRCFELIVAISPEAEQELRLIEALSLLHQCGIDAEPLDIRTSSDRFRFVKQILDTNPEVYKFPNRLLELAEMLGIKAKNRILESVAEKAFLKGDFEFCKDLCEKLIQEQLETCWELCMKLAVAEEFKDSVFKDRILLFALSNCPEDKLTEVAELRNHVNLNQLQRLPVINSHLLPHHTTLLHLCIDPSFWISGEKVKAIPFNKRLQILESLNYRLGYLTREFLGLARQGRLSSGTDSLLLNLALDCFSVDAGLSVVLLGCLSAKSDAENVFDFIVDNSVGSLLAAYYYALEATFHRTDGSLIRKTLYRPVKSIIKEVMDSTNQEDDAFSALLELTKKHGIRCSILKKELLTSSTKHIDTSKADAITKPSSSRAGLNIPDEAKFLSNAEYRRNVILRAAATKDPEMLNNAVRLAKEYGVELWDVAAHFVKFVFTNSSVSLSEINHLLRQSDTLISCLKEKKKEFIRFSGQHIQPLMANAEMDLLERYYEFFENVKRSN